MRYQLFMIASDFPIGQNLNLMPFNRKLIFISN